MLNFILAHAEGDERPYLTIYVLGEPLLGLLDSGASRSILGASGWEQLRRLGLRLRKSSSVCRVADGRACYSPGTVMVPVRVQNVEKLFEFLVVPEISCSVILGADFWSALGIVPDLRRGEWTFSSNGETHLATVGAGDLTDFQRTTLNNLLDRLFRDVDPKRIGCTTLVEHVIVTESEPIKQRYYPISPAMQKVVNAELDEMLEQGIVECSTSPWSSPILLVPKKDKGYRFVVDYRRLNKVTRKDAYPLPFISHTLDKLRDAKFLTTLDIKSAYFQIPLAEESRQYTAFTVPNRGLFQFKRLPMGLSGSPMVWQRFIDRVLGADLDPYVLAYLDDIVIVAPTFEKHLEILEEVLKRILDAGLTLNRDKCQFCRDELRYLGYIVNRTGLHVDPGKIKAILDIPTPRTVSEVRRILGMASWYRRFIRDFSTIVNPLTNLLKKNQRFLWTLDCEKAWSTIKECLVTAPILSCPDFSREFVIQCDSSDFGVGCVLTQNFDDGERVIAYISRSLTKQERNFSTTEKELLSILFGIEKFRPYVEGSHFVVVTDHYSLCWLHNLRNLSGRLARWAVRIQQFDFTVKHRHGKDHVVPDTLSRSVPVIDAARVSASSQDRWYRRLIYNIKTQPEKYPAFRLIRGIPYRFVRNQYPDLSYNDSEWKRVIPKEERSELIRRNHDSPTSGHMGVYKTVHRLRQEVYWPGMQCDVNRYIRRCSVCMRAKPDQKSPAGTMGGHSLIDKPWEVICTDIVGPLPKSKKGNQFILVVSDCFSKFPLFFPMRRATAATVVRHLENDVFLMFGVPKVIISDNGVQFRSREYTNLLKEYSVNPKYTTYYHPQANPTERINRVLKSMLISYISDNHRNWDVVLPSIGCAIRTARHEVIGLTPYFVNFGREMMLSGKDHSSKFVKDQPLVVPTNLEDTFKHRSEALTRVFDDIRLRLQQAYEKSKSRYDLRRRVVEYLPNQVVWRKNFVLSDASKYFSAKLADKFVGPFLIHRAVGKDCYELKDDKENVLPGTWHVSHLKLHPD